MADAERLVGQVLTSPQAADHDDPARPLILVAAGLLQDVDCRPDVVAVGEGVSQD